MTDDEQIRPRYDKQHPERIGEVVSLILTEQYLGEQRPIHALVDEIAELRTRMKDFKPTQKHPTLEHLIEDSTLWKERKRIMDHDMTDDELEQLMGFSNLMSTVNQRQLEPITTALIKFQSHMLTNMGVADTNIDKAISHIRRVVFDFGARAPKTSPLLVLTAAVHDMVKYTGKGFMLGEHEVASAISGAQVLGSALTAAGFGEYAGAMQAFAEKAILCHGEGEFPELQSAASPINEKKDMYQLMVGPQRNFNMGLYLKPPRSNEIMISTSKNPKSKDALDLGREVIRGLSEIDKLDGMSIEAFAKYVADMDTGVFDRYPDVTTMLMGLTDSYVLNYDNAPSAVGAKESRAVQMLRFRTHLMVTLVRDYQEGLLSQHTVEDYRRMLTFLCDEVTAQEIIGEVGNMFSLFKSGKTETDEPHKKLMAARFGRHMLNISELTKKIYATSVTPDIIVNPKLYDTFTRRLSASNQAMREHAGATPY